MSDLNLTTERFREIRGKLGISDASAAEILKADSLRSGLFVLAEALGLLAATQERANTLKEAELRHKGAI
jgi:hypothetical protein